MTLPFLLVYAYLFMYLGVLLSKAHPKSRNLFLKGLASMIAGFCLLYYVIDKASSYHPVFAIIGTLIILGGAVLIFRAALLEAPSSSEN